MKSALFAFAAAVCVASPLAAEPSPGPQPLPMPAPIATPRDLAYPAGTLKLEVDATDIERRIFRITPALEWQLADYTNRLVRVSQICDRNQLAGADDFCRLFIEPEPNATVARQQRDWDHRLAELAPATSAQWQLRRRAAVALAPMLNPQVAQHLLAALNVTGG